MTHQRVKYTKIQYCLRISVSIKESVYYDDATPKHDINDSYVSRIISRVFEYIKMFDLPPNILKHFCNYIPKSIPLTIGFNYDGKNQNQMICPCSSIMYGWADGNTCRISLSDLTPFPNSILKQAYMLQHAPAKKLKQTFTVLSSYNIQ